jgi:hypothetical protein
MNMKLFKKVGVALLALSPLAAFATDDILTTTAAAAVSQATTYVTESYVAVFPLIGLAAAFGLVWMLIRRATKRG